MKIQKRKVNSKRHTVGYKISGKWKTREEAYKLAMMGKIDGVMACQGRYGTYIQSHPDSNLKLYELPEVVDRGYQRTTA